VRRLLSDSFRLQPREFNDGYRSHEVQLSPDGAKVFVITAENPALPDLLTAQLIDLASGEIQWKHKLPAGPCGPSGFSPDGTLVATSVCSNRGALVVWDVATGIERARFESIPKTAWGGRGKKLAISSDNTRLAVAMMNTTTLIWDISEAK
jgi:WD40 repeat protein